MKNAQLPPRPRSVLARSGSSRAATSRWSVNLNAWRMRSVRRWIGLSTRSRPSAGASHSSGVHLLWFGGWMLMNLLPRSPFRFDPFPFQLLTLVVSLEAIFLSTFILITQSRQALLADRRNRLDLQINLLTEQENTMMLSLLEQIARRVGVNVARDEELQAMKEATSPERLVDSDPGGYGTRRECDRNQRAGQREPLDCRRAWLVAFPARGLLFR